ncbi:hypothetical protein SVA_1716 [Sulfurifustis variabilis]|uniref:Uncharacterized protein n=1 Tax=Sulfurifustis variabilis TaxID=1675686 RepID=A0A1B4V404_9GAMM|nr:hypothetical protein SVA_1716 [Sulfurifustis variabilis]
MAIPPSTRSLPVPADRRARIWRYMNFAKFVSLIDAEALFFAPVGRFSDTREGGGAAAPPDVAVSSWHLSDHESEAMWRLYSPREEAVAVQSTYERLRGALPDCVRIHQVTYVDEPERQARTDHLSGFFYKRRAYEHEKELRAVFPLADAAAAGDRARATDGGWFFGIDADGVVERVYVSPFAADWFRAVVVGVTRRYGHRFPVERSALTGTV